MWDQNKLPSRYHLIVLDCYFLLWNAGKVSSTKRSISRKHPSAEVSGTWIYKRYIWCWWCQTPWMAWAHVSYQPTSHIIWSSALMSHRCFYNWMILALVKKRVLIWFFHDLIEMGSRHATGVSWSTYQHWNLPYSNRSESAFCLCSFLCNMFIL